jgi:hypothetical protein
LFPKKKERGKKEKRRERERKKKERLTFCGSGDQTQDLIVGKNPDTSLLPLALGPISQPLERGILRANAWCGLEEEVS